MTLFKYDWTEMRLDLAKRGKSPEVIEQTIDRWYLIVASAAALDLAGLHDDDPEADKVREQTRLQLAGGRL